MAAKASLSERRILSKIIAVRGQTVILDSDLAELYGVETRRLNEQVRRNRVKFPDDFMEEGRNQPVMQKRDAF